MTESPASQPGSQRYGTKMPLTEEERMNIPRPPRPAPERRRRGGLGVAISVVIVAVVILVALWYVFLRPGTGNSPEGAFRGLVDAINRADAEDAVGHTTLHFASGSDFQSEVASLEDKWVEDGQMQITIKSIVVLYYDD